MTTPEIEVLFRTWWGTSYPTPPGAHACMTHCAFAQWLLQYLASTPTPTPAATPTDASL